MDTGTSMDAGDAAGAPADASQAPADSSATGGYTIELKVGADGQMSVSVEVDGSDDSGADQAGSAGAPPTPEAGDDDQGQAVPNLAAAFKLIKEIVNHAGQMADAGSGDAEMSGGYGAQGM